MPTAARLFAGIAFALVAYFASDVFKPLLPEGTRDGMLSPMNAVLGFLCGWIVMGPLAGRGYYAAAGFGVRTSATFLFFALLSWSCYEMVRLSMDKRFGGPMEAITAMFGMITDYFMLLFSDVQGPVVLLIGGVLGGALAEWASKRFA